MLGLRRFRSLVRGVSNHGAAPSFETGATRGIAFLGSARTCALLRMRRKNGQHLSSRVSSSETRLSAANLRFLSFVAARSFRNLKFKAALDS
jgi:hypothetical protein